MSDGNDSKPVRFTMTKAEVEAEHRPAIEKLHADILHKKQELEDLQKQYDACVHTYTIQAGYAGQIDKSGTKAWMPKSKP